MLVKMDAKCRYFSGRNFPERSDMRMVRVCEDGDAGDDGMFSWMVCRVGFVGWMFASHVPQIYRSTADFDTAESRTFIL